ncbi:MAG: hypothetical protein CML02_14620 [Pseudooceanicola sp.]|nr:hypothetical protein [Pseudooceanicola sp.]
MIPFIRRLATKPTRSLALALVIASPATADHWMQTADPPVVQALNELAMVYGNACQMGNQQACWMAQNVQSQGGMMLNAGYECQVNGNPQACAFYQNAYAQLSQAYAATQQAMTQGQKQQPAPGYGGQMGTTHAERMQQIQNWGQERLQWGQQQQQMMDRNHERFMETLRN